jgi:N-acetylmuramoyl-L-alanine amidase-like protein
MIIIPDLIPDANIWRNSVEKGNFNKGRAGSGKVRILVWHATVGGLQASRARFRNKLQEVSAHYFVDRDGSIYQEVLESDTAYHAGISQWAGLTNINYCSIGIEIVNKNDGQEPIGGAQLQSCIDLGRYLTLKYDIQRSMQTRHLDVAPGRKSDPRDLDWGAFLNSLYDGSPSPSPTPAPTPAPTPTPGTPNPSPTPTPNPPSGEGGGSYTEGQISRAISGAIVEFINLVIGRLRGG